ncbi:hypothetical protein FB107DRAFT_271706 [Schizophyllum commune]
MAAPGPQPRDIDYEAKLAEFDKIPLFMKSLPEEDTEDATIAALQDLAYEGTPDEVAQNFKEQGNDYFKGKRWREALGFYTQAIDAKPTDPALQEALLCNRAACNLELKNYGSVLRDCSKAITLNPRSAKAFYRSALALLALERAEDALDCCDRALAFDANNLAMKGLRERAVKLIEQKEAKKRAQQQREMEKLLMQKALKARGLFLSGDKSDAMPQWDPEDATKSSLLFPVFFLYPQHAQSDFIKEFHEDTPFSAHLEAMFPPQAPPPEWDKAGEYVTGNLNVYAMTRGKRLLKVGKNHTLRTVFEAARAKEGQPRDGLELRDGCLSFVVLPKGEVEKKWIEDYKKAREQ